MSYIKHVQFNDIDIKDSFFDSLKSDYPGFENWFARKNDEDAYVFYEDNSVNGFLYLKQEVGPILDVDPSIPFHNVIKIGTFKINPHGTRLGERFIKKALDYAVVLNAECCYVTIFEKHDALIQLFYKYGFERYAVKNGPSENELVLVRDLTKLRGNILHDFPLLNTNKNKYLLAIYPQYHSAMFPDSILNNESVDILKDVTHTNSIHKIYVTSMPVYRANPGDILIMYRTRTDGQSAEYTSVATSVCVVEEVRSQTEFADFEDFYSYATTYSIFDKSDLRYWYDRGNCYTIKMTYNAALSKRLIRKKLIEDIGLDRGARWSFIKLTDQQFFSILEEGGVSESIIIN
jgi:hypothetical protein